MFFSTEDLEFEDRKQTHRIHNSTVLYINKLITNTFTVTSY